ncbi:hypothetical protein HDU76_012706 [Blyttiomyces sp. JEL0837]|nr:hypothetical protein HDU76_012706 [Blyttiomyces sp. JEL0837]
MVSLSTVITLAAAVALGTVSSVNAQCFTISANSLCGPDYAGLPAPIAAFATEDAMNAFLQTTIDTTALTSKFIDREGCTSATPAYFQSNFRYQLSYWCSKILVDAIHANCGPPPGLPILCSEQCTIASGSVSAIVNNPNLCPASGNATINANRNDVVQRFMTQCSDSNTVINANNGGTCVKGVPAEISNCGFSDKATATTQCTSLAAGGDTCCQSFIASLPQTSSSSSSSTTQPSQTANPSSANVSPSQSSASNSSSSSSISTGLLIPVVAAAAAVIVFAMVGAAFYIRHRRKKQQEYSSSFNPVQYNRGKGGKPGSMRSQYSNDDNVAVPGSVAGYNSNFGGQSYSSTTGLMSTASAGQPVQMQPLSPVTPLSIGMNSGYQYPQQMPPSSAGGYSASTGGGNLNYSSPTSAYTISQQQQQMQQQGVIVSSGVGAGIITKPKSGSMSSQQSSTVGQMSLNQQQPPPQPPIQPVAPAGLVQGPPSASLSTTSSSSTSSQPLIMKVLHPYAPTLADELELQVGQEVVVLRAFDDGWGLGMNPATGAQGAFPLVCVTSTGGSSSSGSGQGAGQQGEVKVERDQQARLSAMIQRGGSRNGNAGGVIPKSGV